MSGLHFFESQIHDIVLFQIPPSILFIESGPLWWDINRHKYWQNWKKSNESEVKNLSETKHYTLQRICNDLKSAQEILLTQINYYSASSRRSCIMQRHASRKIDKRELSFSLCYLFNSKQSFQHWVIFCYSQNWGEGAAVDWEKFVLEPMKLLWKKIKNFS